MTEYELLIVEQNASLEEYDANLKEQTKSFQQAEEDKAALQGELALLKEKMRKNEVNVNNFINEMGKLLANNNPMLMVNMMKYNLNNTNNNSNNNHSDNDTNFNSNTSNTKKKNSNSNNNTTNKENYLIFCVETKHQN